MNHIEYQYILADDFDRAWLNFELDLPLNVTTSGQPNPFYVARTDDAVAKLLDDLTAPFFKPPKFFFSGHRGCGKSTELRQLAQNEDINRKYWVLHFSIRDYADINDLDYRDVLLIIASQLYTNFIEQGYEIPKGLQDELEHWQKGIRTEIETLTAPRITDMEFGASLKGLFSELSGKIKLEPATRQTMRQVFERKVSSLVDIINNLSAVVQAKTQRFPLILIDDLDKPDIKQAVEIFYQRRETMQQPNCAIVYTISSALFYSKQFEAIRDEAIFLPNIKLHPKQKRDELDTNGYTTMREFVHKRAKPHLIAPDALDLGISYSGGVFREMARIMREAVGRARRRRANQIVIDDIENAVNSLRNEYRRFLDKSDIQLMKQVRNTNELGDKNDADHGRLCQLLQIIALLEYRNGKNWCDIHPALDQLLDEVN